MGRKQAMAVGLALVAVLIGAGLGMTTDQLPSALPEGAPEVDEPEPGTLAVHVSGWVATPGVVEVVEGSLVADAVLAAGGALDGAELDAMNLAAPVLDGDHIQVPGPGETIPPGGGEGGGGDGGGGLISLNRADAAALEALPGVGPVLAGRIVAHREDNGPFQVVEDLLDVSGIGEAKLASIRDLVVP